MMATSRIVFVVLVAAVSVSSAYAAELVVLENGRARIAIDVVWPGLRKIAGKDLVAMARRASGGRSDPPRATRIAGSYAIHVDRVTARKRSRAIFMAREGLVLRIVFEADRERYVEHEKSFELVVRSLRFGADMLGSK